MLNPSLDVAALAQRYREKQRLQIPDILDAELAERIHQCLTRETPWGVVYNEGARNVTVEAEELRTMRPEERGRRAMLATQRAGREFQFLYHAYLMLTNYQAGKNKDLFLNTIFEGLNSEPMLDLVRAVTGIPTIIKCDAQATLYAPGHFLTRHNDDADVTLHRRVAYVLGFTKSWHPDWGGLLQFYDDNDNVTDVFMPRFNSLSLFTVPQYHAVTYVAPYAPMGRLAITGWFQDP